MNEYLEKHNNQEHNFHTDWQESGFDICIECDLIRRTGGLLDWEENELASEQEYARGRGRINGIL